ARSRDRHRALRTDKLPHDNEQPKREQAGQAAHPLTARLSWPPGRARWTAKTRKALTAKPSAPLVMAYAHVRSGRSACWVLISPQPIPSGLTSISATTATTSADTTARRPPTRMAGMAAGSTILRRRSGPD